MPELPEVETIMQGLVPVLQGHNIETVCLNRPDLRQPFPPELKRDLSHQKVMKLRRRAKYILADLENGVTLLIHLGMSGRLFIDAPPLPEKIRKHEHFSVTTEEGIKISLVDPRRFGLVSTFTTKTERDVPLLSHLGLEPLDPEGLPAKRLYEIFEKKRTSIKSALLDQTIIAGLGNIYVCEALFRAGIHPQREAGSLNLSEITHLCEVIPILLKQAVRAGGSTLRDYVRTDGQKGKFQELHQVYGREGKPCPICPGAPKCCGIRRIMQSGRSSFYCPVRQKREEGCT